MVAEDVTKKMLTNRRSSLARGPRVCTSLPYAGTPCFLCCISSTTYTMWRRWIALLMLSAGYVSVAGAQYSELTAAATSLFEVSM